MSFREVIPDEEAGLDAVEVYTSDDGRFVTVETDAYEGSAMMSVPAAEALIPVLQRAIEAARKESAPKPTPEIQPQA